MNNDRDPYIRNIRVRHVVIPVGPSIAYVPLTRGLFALIDACDAPLVRQWNWHAWFSKDSHSFYAMRTAHKSNAKSRTVRMHRVILDCHRDTVDHIDPDRTLDNRRANLRFATSGQQAKNKVLPRHNTTGMKGISLHRLSGKWQAEIRADNKRIYLGLHMTPEDAHAAYCAAAKRYHGEFARTA